MACLIASLLNPSSATCSFGSIRALDFRGPVGGDGSQTPPTTQPRHLRCHSG
jgi:hypothetical protein